MGVKSCKNLFSINFLIHLHNWVVVFVQLKIVFFFFFFCFLFWMVTWLQNLKLRNRIKVIDFSSSVCHTWVMGSNLERSWAMEKLWGYNKRNKKFKVNLINIYSKWYNIINTRICAFVGDTSHDRGSRSCHIFNP